MRSLRIRNLLGLPSGWEALLALALLAHVGCAERRDAKVPRGGNADAHAAASEPRPPTDLLPTPSAGEPPKSPLEDASAPAAPEPPRVPVGPRPTSEVATDIPIEELVLLGVVVRPSPSRAMLANRSGFGYIVKVGDFVGASAADGTRWRVDRVGDSSVSLVLCEPGGTWHTSSARRVMPLAKRTSR